MLTIETLESVIVVDAALLNSRVENRDLRCGFRNRNDLDPTGNRRVDDFRIQVNDRFDQNFIFGIDFFGTENPQKTNYYWMYKRFRDAFERYPVKLLKKSKQVRTVCFILHYAK